MKKLTITEAGILSKATDYALTAVRVNVPVNWFDATVFYMEGYNQAVKDMESGGIKQHIDSPRKKTKICRNCDHFMPWGVNIGVCILSVKKVRDKMEWDRCKKFQQRKESK